MELVEMFGDMTAETWLGYNAKLQLKKNALRKALKERGILKKGGVNKFDNYTYFSEAQYKELFTELLSEHGLEMKFTEISYTTFEGTEKQANGRMPRLEFSLIDVETGFYETTVITGEGIDKGDKGGYKAYTGALKYYLADTFLVATGDDPEKDSPDHRMNTVRGGEPKVTDAQLRVIRQFYTGETLQKLLDANGITDIADLSRKKASELCEQLIKRKGKDNG